MGHFDFFAFAGIILVFILLGVLFLIPTEKRSSARRIRPPKGPEETEKDWQGISLKLEKRIHDLRQEVAEAKRKERKLERELLVQGEKYKLAQEKLSQERTWQQKEQGDNERVLGEIQKAKDNLKTTEENLEQEHRQRLAYERELRDLKKELVESTSVKKDLEIQLAKAIARADVSRKEALEVRGENAKLNKKHEEATFVAKSDYVKLEQELKDARREIERLKELIRKKGIE